jgi:hypothetical protein
MTIKNVQRFGEWVPNDRIVLYNRSGATVNAGDCLAVDLVGSHQGHTLAQYTADLGTSGDDQVNNPLGNAIAIASASGHDSGWVIVVCLDSSIADNACGRFGVRGLFDVEVVGGGAVAIGDRVGPTDAQTYLSKESDGLGICGIAMAAGAAGATPTTIKVLFDGWKCAFGSQAEV